MNASNDNEPSRFSTDEAVRSAIAAYVDELEASGSSPLNSLDRWTRRRIFAETSAKTKLVLDAGDRVEHCYQNLIREIDIEAEMGVLLANRLGGPNALRAMCEDPGVSGELLRKMDRIAPGMFTDEFEHSNGDLDLVWATVQARYDRARFEAETSGLMMAHFLDDDASVSDMTSALRSMFYSFHEECTRRQFDMTSLLDQREAHELYIMVSELMKRAGSYEDRVQAIGREAGTA